MSQVIYFDVDELNRKRNIASAPATITQTHLHKACKKRAATESAIQLARNNGTEFGDLIDHHTALTHEIQLLEADLADANSRQNGATQ